MSVKKYSEEIQGHPPRRKVCKGSPDGKHFLEPKPEKNSTISVITGPTVNDFVEKTSIYHHECIYCGKNDLTLGD